MIDDDIIEKVKANIFYGARDSIQDWENFKWHTSNNEIDTYRPHSSQALPIDVFGTIQNSKDKNEILNKIASQLKVPFGGEWEIYLEWEDPHNLLNEIESAKTQVDVVAKNDKSILFIESKFTERSGGTCSQPHKRKKNEIVVQQCNGKYSYQTNPINGIKSKCALSGKCILYWDIIPQIFFNYNKEDEYCPCPFKGPWFQWMRNIVLAYRYGEVHDITPAVLLAYVNDPVFPISRQIKNGKIAEFNEQINRRDMHLSPLSYQQILEISLGQSRANVQPFQDLYEWVAEKIRKSKISK